MRRSTSASLGVLVLGLLALASACRETTAPGYPSGVPLGRFALVRVNGQPLPYAFSALPDADAQQVDSAFIVADTAVFVDDPPSPSPAQTRTVRFTETVRLRIVDVGRPDQYSVQVFGGSATLTAQGDSLRLYDGGFVVGGAGALRGDTLSLLSDQTAVIGQLRLEFVRRTSQFASRNSADRTADAARQAVAK